MNQYTYYGVKDYFKWLCALWHSDEQILENQKAADGDFMTIGCQYKIDTLISSPERCQIWVVAHHLINGVKWLQMYKKKWCLGH